MAHAHGIPDVFAAQAGQKLLAKRAEVDAAQKEADLGAVAWEES